MMLISTGYVAVRQDPTSKMELLDVPTFSAFASVTRALAHKNDEERLDGRAGMPILRIAQVQVVELEAAA